MDYGVTIEDYHALVLAGIRDAFPALQTVDDYRAAGGDLAVPACLVEMVAIEAAPGEDLGTGHTSVMVRMEARFVIGHRTPEMEREVRRLAGAFIHHLRDARWNMTIDAAEFLTAGPDDLDPGLDRFGVWRVEWQQMIDLGEEDWSGDGVAPSSIHIGWSPRIGAGHADDYDRVDS